jgi:hypothetical protein
VLFALLVRTIGLTLYPPLETLAALGAKFPQWALSVDGTSAYVLQALPLAIVAGALGGLVAGALPRPTRQVYSRAFLLKGTVASLAAFLVATIGLG